MGHHRGDRASGLNQRDPRHATYCNRFVDPVLVSTSRNIFQSQKYFHGTFSVPKIFSRNIFQLRRTSLLCSFALTPRQRVPRGVLFPIRVVGHARRVKAHAVNSREAILCMCRRHIVGLCPLSGGWRVRIPKHVGIHAIQEFLND